MYLIKIRAKLIQGFVSKAGGILSGSGVSGHDQWSFGKKTDTG